MTSRLALGFVFLVAGTLWLLAAAGAIDLSYGAAIGVLLVVIGLAIALVPGRHGALVVLGILVAIAGIPALLVGSDVFSGGVGDRLETPATAAELEDFQHGIGQLVVDLTTPGLDLDERTVVASIGIGELVVRVPEDVDVTVDVHGGIGNAEALGRTESGLDVTLEGISGTSGSQELDLELDAGIGNVRVEQRG